jgi:hypothetical protein
MVSRLRRLLHRHADIQVQIDFWSLGGKKKSLLRLNVTLHLTRYSPESFRFPDPCTSGASVTQLTFHKGLHLCQKEFLSTGTQHQFEPILLISSEPVPIGDELLCDYEAQTDLVGANPAPFALSKTFAQSDRNPKVYASMK